MSGLHPHIRTVMDETGQIDPVSAVRAKVRSVIADFHRIFGAAPPFNLEALASFRGLHVSADAPRYSQDSEIAPQPNGRVVLRVNRDRPITRQRFSIGHEIGHTLFPEYQLTVRCRKSTDRDWADPEDLLETLCDIAASEILFPEPWFREHVATMELTAAEVVRLATAYQASRDATVRHLVEVHSVPLAAVFLTWKLKPTEIRRIGQDRDQQRMFADDELSKPQPRLRVDYAVVNTRFEVTFCDHIPKDKSVPREGPIYESSQNQEPCDGMMFLDLGTVARDFIVHAVPIYTPDESVGPDGGVAVVALLHPTY